MIEKIPLNADNRMLRFGFGKHDGRWFARIDLWWAGFRLCRNQQSSMPEERVIPELAMDGKPFTSDDQLSGATLSFLAVMGQELK
jgi:hypothetical protein